MGDTTCTFEFNNASRIFYSGQTIAGRVHLYLPNDKKARGVYIIISGFAHVNWTESETRRTSEGRDETVYIEYYSDTQYLHSKTQVFHPPDSNSGTMPQGTHSYDFYCALPSALPTSFEGTYGHIRYLVEVRMDRPWKFDHVFKQPFTVLSHCDLNLSPSLRQPIVHQENKRVLCCWCFCCCPQGPMIIDTSIPQSGYAPGQNVMLAVNMSNQSGMTIEDIKIKFNKNITYTSHYPHQKDKSEDITLVGKQIQGFNDAKEGSFIETITIPSVPPTDKLLCPIIKVVYSIIVEFNIGGCCRSNPKVYIPIVIGTVPLYRLSQGDGTITSQPTPSAPEIMSIDTPPPYPDMPPPSYEEAVGGKVNIKDGAGDGNHPVDPYAPMYPVYQYSSTAANAGHSSNIGWTMS